MAPQLVDLFAEGSHSSLYFVQHILSVAMGYRT
jgi:hypothetical protein